jgi:hypothetical protein
MTGAARSLGAIPVPAGPLAQLRRRRGLADAVLAGAEVVGAAGDDVSLLVARPV